MKKVILSALFLTTMAVEAQQSYVGLRESNYSGIFPVTSNPANMISSKRSWDANIATVNFGFGNNAIKLTPNITDSFNEYTRVDTQNAIFGYNNINAKINVDVLGPSAFVKINDQHTVGIFSRVRLLGNVRNVDAKMLQSFVSDLDKLELKTPYQVNLNDQEIVVNAFSEVGFSWSGEVYFDGTNTVKVGASAKLVQGSGNVYVGFKDFEGSATLTPDTDKDKVNLNIQSANGTLEVLNGGMDLVDFDNVKVNKLYFSSEATTLAFDLGATYEFRKDGCPRCHNNPHDLRVGISLMDLGRLQYTANKNSYRYKMPATQSTTLSIDDLSEENLKNHFDGTKATGSKLRSSLPSTFNLSADYRVVDAFYLNLSGQVNIASTKDKELYNATYANELSLTPHYDTNSFGAYLPISYNQVSKANVGIALRLGPLVLGSSTILGNVLTRSAKEFNFFFGLRFGHQSYPVDL